MAKEILLDDGEYEVVRWKADNNHAYWNERFFNVTIYKKDNQGLGTMVTKCYLRKIWAEKYKSDPKVFLEQALPKRLVNLRRMRAKLEAKIADLAREEMEISDRITKQG